MNKFDFFVTIVEDFKKQAIAVDSQFRDFYEYDYSPVFALFYKKIDYKGSFIVGDTNILYRVHGVGCEFIINSNAIIDIDYYGNNGLILRGGALKRYIDTLPYCLFDYLISDCYILLEKMEKMGSLVRVPNNNFGYFIV